MSEEYYSVLARTIMDLGRDHAQLRLMVYRFARTELRVDLYRKRSVSYAEINRQISALEDAIERIESDVANGATMFRTHSPEEGWGQQVTNPSKTALVVQREWPQLRAAIDDEGHSLPHIIDRSLPQQYTQPVLAGC